METKETEYLLKSITSEDKHPFSREREYGIIVLGATVVTVAILVGSYILGILITIATLTIVKMARNEAKKVMICITEDDVSFGGDHILGFDQILNYNILNVIGEKAKLFIYSTDSFANKYVISIYDEDIAIIHDIFKDKKIPINGNLRFTWLDKLTYYF